jgi:hypothetical protein
VRNSQVTEFEGCARFWGFCFVLHSGDRILICRMDLFVKKLYTRDRNKDYLYKKKKSRRGDGCLSVVSVL